MRILEKIFATIVICLLFLGSFFIYISSKRTVENNMVMSHSLLPNERSAILSYLSRVADSRAAFYKGKDLFFALQQYLLLHPDDARAQEIIAPIYLRLGAVEDAIYAYKAALRWQEIKLANLNGLGEALVLSSGGVVTEVAQAIFMKAASLDSQDYISRLYIARALVQDGKISEARQYLADFIKHFTSNIEIKLMLKEVVNKLDSAMKIGDDSFTI